MHFVEGCEALKINKLFHLISKIFCVTMEMKPKNFKPDFVFRLRLISIVKIPAPCFCQYLWHSNISDASFNWPARRCLIFSHLSVMDCMESQNGSVGNKDFNRLIMLYLWITTCESRLKFVRKILHKQRLYGSHASCWILVSTHITFLGFHGTFKNNKCRE